MLPSCSPTDQRMCAAKSHHPRRCPPLSVDELLEALLPDPCVDIPCLDTPYSKYSNTNYAASGRDVRVITEIVTQRATQLDDVSAELASVESIMAHVRDVHQQLFDKRNKIVASMQVHRGLISCIRRLPSEILGEIFVRCLPPGPHIEPDPSVAPLLLLAVCRGWRKVALGTPRLWCSLSVQPGRGVQQRCLYFYHHWLSRTRGCPLSLTVDSRRQPNNPVWRYEVTELLQPYTSRATQLHITFDEATAPDLLLKDVPMLQHLTLDGDLRTTQGMVIVQPRPQLRSLTLNAVALGADALSTFNPGWKHLTQLRVSLCWTPSSQDTGTVGSHILLSLLELCPLLQNLSFAPVFVSRQDAPLRALSHTQLRSLDIVVLYGAGCFLDALTLPSLRYLKIRDLDIIPPSATGWHSEFKAFLTRSRCPLETLMIHGVRVTIRKADRQEFTTLIPTLKHLDFSMAGTMRG